MYVVLIATAICAVRSDQYDLGCRRLTDVYTVDHCYTVHVKRQLSNMAAVKSCQLVSIPDAETNEWLTIMIKEALNLTSESSTDFWIGAKFQQLDKWTWLNGNENDGNV